MDSVTQEVLIAEMYTIACKNGYKATYPVNLLFELKPEKLEFDYVGQIDYRDYYLILFSPEFQIKFCDAVGKNHQDVMMTIGPMCDEDRFIYLQRLLPR
jgi:hypothetical protein